MRDLLWFGVFFTTEFVQAILVCLSIPGEFCIAVYEALVPYFQVFPRTLTESKASGGAGSFWESQVERTVPPG